MSAETSGDVCHIKDEDILRKMWQDTEDFGKKKEIRSHMYKLREERLRNFYSSSDPGTEINTTQQSHGLYKKSLNDGNGPTHADSLLDHSFLSLKSKEIRDSESPTKEMHHFRINDKNRGGNHGWDIVSKNEISNDGKTYTTTKLATTEGTEKIDKGTANYSAKCEQKSSVYEDGDANNFTKSAATASKSVLQQEAKGGDENSSFRTSSTSSSSSSKVVSQHHSNSGVTALPINENDSSAVVIRKSYTTDVPAELKRSPNYIDGNTTVTTETRTLPDGTKVTTTRYETKGVSSKMDKQQFHTEEKMSSTKSVNDKQTFRQQTGNDDNQKTMRIEVIRNTTDNIQKPNAVHEVRKTTDSTNVDETVRITQNQDVRKTTQDNRDDVFISKIIREKEYNPRDRQPTTTHSTSKTTSDNRDDVYVTKVVRENEYTSRDQSPQPAHNLPKTPHDNRDEVYITKISREQNYIPSDERPTYEVTPTEQDSVKSSTTRDVLGKTTTTTVKTTKTTHEDQYQPYEQQPDRERVPSDTKPANRQPSEFTPAGRKPGDSTPTERTLQEHIPVDRTPDESVPTMSTSCNRTTTHYVIEDHIPVTIRPVDQTPISTPQNQDIVTKLTPQKPDRYTQQQPDLNGDQVIIERTVTTTTLNNQSPDGNRPKGSVKPQSEKITTVTSNTTYKTDYTTKRISVDISPTHDAFARSLRASPDRDKRRGSIRSLKSSTSSLRSSTSPEKNYPYSKHPDSSSLDRKQPTKLSPTSRPRQDFREPSPTKRVISEKPTCPTGRSPKKPAEDINTNTITRRHKTDVYTEETRTSKKSLDAPRDKPRNRDTSIDSNIISRPSRIRPRSRSVSPTTSASDIEFVKRTDTVTDLDDDSITAKTTTTRTTKQIHTTSRPNTLDVRRPQPVTHHAPTSPTKKSPTKEKPQEKPLKRRDTYEDRCRQMLGINTNTTETTTITRTPAKISPKEDLPLSRKSPEKKVDRPKKEQPKIQEYPSQIRRSPGGKKPQDTPDHPTDNESYIREYQQTTHKTVKKDSPDRYRPTGNESSPDKQPQRPTTRDSKPQSRKPDNQSPDRSDRVTEEIDEIYTTNKSINRQTVTKTNRTSPEKSRKTPDQLENRPTKPKGRTPTDQSQPDEYCIADESFDITFTTTRPRDTTSPNRIGETPERTGKRPVTEDGKPSYRQPTDESPERPRHVTKVKEDYYSVDEKVDHTITTGTTPNRKSPNRHRKTPDEPTEDFNPDDQSPDRSRRVVEQHFVTESIDHTTINARPGDKPGRVTPDRGTKIPEPKSRKPQDQSPDGPKPVSEKTDQCYITNESIDRTVTTKTTHKKAPIEPEEEPKSRVPRPNDKSTVVTKQTTTTTENIREPNRVQKKPDYPERQPTTDHSRPTAPKPSNRSPERPSHFTEKTDEYCFTNESVDQTFVTTKPGEKPEKQSPTGRKPTDETPNRPSYVTDDKYYVTNESVDRTVVKTRPGDRPENSPYQSPQTREKPTTDDSRPRGRKPKDGSPERPSQVTETTDECYLTNESIDRTITKTRPEKTTSSDERPTKDDTRPKGRKPTDESPYIITKQTDEYYITNQKLDRTIDNRPEDKPGEKGTVPARRRPSDDSKPKGHQSKPDIDECYVTDTIVDRKTTTITKDSSSRPKQPTDESPDRPEKGTIPIGRRPSRDSKPKGRKPDHSPDEPYTVTQLDEYYVTDDKVDRQTTITKHQTSPDRRTPSSLDSKPKQPTDTWPDRPYGVVKQTGDYCVTNETIERTNIVNKVSPDEPRKRPSVDGYQPKDRRPEDESPDRPDEIDVNYITTETIDRKTISTNKENVPDRTSPERPRKVSRKPHDESPERPRVKPHRVTEEIDITNMSINRTVTNETSDRPDRKTKPGKRPITDDSKPKSQRPGEYSPERSHRVVDQTDEYCITDEIVSERIPGQAKGRTSSNKSPDRRRPVTKETDEYYITNDVVDHKTVTTKSSTTKDRRSPDRPRKQPTTEGSKPEKHRPHHTTEEIHYVTDESVDRKILTTKTKDIPDKRYQDKNRPDQPGRRPSTEKPKPRQSPERYRVTEEIDQCYTDETVNRRTVTGKISDRPDKGTRDKTQKVPVKPGQRPVIDDSKPSRKPSNQSPDRTNRVTEQTDESVERRTVITRPGDKPERKSPVKKVYTTTTQITKPERNVGTSPNRPDVTEYVDEYCKRNEKPSTKPGEKIVTKTHIPSVTKKPTRTETLPTKGRKPVEEVFTATNTYLTSDKSTVHRLIKPDRDTPRKKQPDATVPQQKKPVSETPGKHHIKLTVTKPEIKQTTREVTTKTDNRKYKVETHQTINNVRKSAEEYTSDEDTLVENVETTDENVYRELSPDRIGKKPREDDFYTLNIKVYRNDAKTHKITKPTQEETDSETDSIKNDNKYPVERVPQSPHKPTSKPKSTLPRNQPKPDKVVYRTEEKHYINKTTKKPIKTVSPDRCTPTKQIPKTQKSTRTVTNQILTTRDSKTNLKTKPKPDVTRHVVTTTIQVVPKTKKPSQPKAPTRTTHVKTTKTTSKTVKSTPRIPSDDDSEIEEYVVDGEDIEETNRSFDRQITRTINSPQKSETPSKTDFTRRPEKVITTKSIVVNHDLQHEKEVVVNLQRSKSSREATPDRSYAYPASDSEDRGVPRYPDQICEPDDGFKRRTPTKLSDIPIIEADSDYPSRTLNKVDDTDECLLSVNEKVTKFVNEAGKLTKPRTNKSHETDFYKTVTRTDERLNVVHQTPDRPKSPKCANYPEFVDEETYGTVSKKVSHFIETAEKIKTQQKTAPPPKVTRPEFTDLEEHIKTDDCLLSVSDKVSKFTTAQKHSPNHKKPVSLAKMDVSHSPRESPPATECVHIDSEEDTYIRKPSPDTYSRSYNSNKSPDESITEPDTTPKSSRKDSESKTVLSTTSRLRSTESIRRAKEIFENIAKDQTVTKQHRSVTKPPAGHKPPIDDVKLSKIGVYDTKPRKSQPNVDVDNYDLKSTRLVIEKINRPRSPSKDGDVPGYLRPLDRSPRPRSPYRERSESPKDRSRSPSLERAPKPHDPSLDKIPHYMWPLDRSVHEHEHEHEHSHSPDHEPTMGSRESSPSYMKPLDRQLRTKSPSPTPKDVTDKPSKYGNVPRKSDADKVCSTTTQHRKFSTVEIENILTTHEIEEIYDIEILEVLLEWAANYEQRRRVRSQIRVVKQLTVDNKLPAHLLKKTHKVVTTRVKEPSVEKSHRTSSKKVEEHASYTYNERRRSSEIKTYTREISPETKVIHSKSPDRKTELKRVEPVSKKVVEEKPSWVTQRPLKKPSGDVPKTKPVSTTKKQEPRASPSKERKSTDVITSSYGVGPTDENGSPLFGLKALRAQTRTGTTKVQGTVIKSHYYSENGHEPTGEVSVTKYSTDPSDFEGAVDETNGLVSLTTTQKFGTKGTPTYKAIADRRDYPEDENIEEYESRKTTSTNVTRRGSVKQISKKFIDNAVETSKNERQSSYPKAGLILRTSSFKKTASLDSRESSPESSALTTTTVRKTTTTSSSSSGGHGDTFLNNQTRVRNVQDVITRMKNADDDVQEGDTVEDVEARKLLNKFIGSQVILSGMETHASSSPSVASATRRTTTTTTTTSKGSGKPTVVTRTFTHPITQEDLDTIWDEPTLKLLLERSTDYEERRIIRGRLRDVMAEKEVCADVVSKTSEESSGRVEETVEKTEGPITTTQVTTRVTSHQVSKKPLSPFAKFRQLDKQNSLNTPPGTPRTPTGSTPLFKFTDPELNRQASTVKERLLQWCQMKTKEYENVQLDNFSSSWADGLAFCALIHHFRPDAFDYHALTPKDRRHNFTLAFRIADEKADIVPLLDVDDMVATRKPDWKCVFTYVQTIYARFKNED